MFKLALGFCVLYSMLYAGEDPLTLKPTDDTFLTPDVAGKPGGRGERNEFQIYGGADGKQGRALLRFDMGDLKAPPAVAVLRVHVFNAGAPPKSELVRCHAVVREWSEKSASWDQCQENDLWSRPGGDWDPQPLSGFNIPVSMGGEKGYWLEFDITPIVQAWIAKQRPNYGVVLMLDPGSKAELRCNSKENNASGPELKLAWTAKLDRGAAVMGSKLRPYGDPVKLDPEWTTAALNQVRAGAAFKQQLTVRGGAKPIKFTADKLPEGVTLSPEGVLEGTVAKAGRVSVNFTAKGADGRSSSKRLDIDVAAGDVAAKGDKPAEGGGNPLLQNAKPAEKTEPKPSGKKDDANE